jgi:N-acetylglutamate synthase-like GNAT family acetyltransferase
MVQLRIAGNADVEGLMDLINAAFRKAEGYIIDRDRVDLEVVESLLAKGEFLVAEEESSLAGCVYLELRGERAYLGLLSVDPTRQKAGVGSMLMREAELHCDRAGCRFIDLKTIDLRKDNRAFYKRRGYVETGTEPFPSDLDAKLPCHFVNMSKPLP